MHHPPHLAPEAEFESHGQYLEYLRAARLKDERQSDARMVGQIAAYCVCALIIAALVFRHR